MKNLILITAEVDGNRVCVDETPMSPGKANLLMHNARYASVWNGKQMVPFFKHFKAIAYELTNLVRP